MQPWERHLLHQAMASLGLACECPPRAPAPVAFHPKRIPKKGLGIIERRVLREAAKRAGF